MNLTGVSASSREVRSREDARGRDQYEPTFTATLDNVTDGANTEMVAFYVGDYLVGERSRSVPQNETATVSVRASWETLMAAVGTGEQTLRAELRGSSMVARQTIRVHSLRTDEGDDQGDDSAGFPTLPAVGGLTRKQTTGAAALVAAVLMAVVL
ncbi:hypothetical protein C475_17833 [Halosimplex carlsbadense 2-9-1]|uniref:CARDB domain-containing protein n=1 Tax=Halosimplex carlsbadense 2-9-1 TaxID=797114 RepID=M0CJ57_9EURY|nr:hypothetical protein C475_17833 [Halosimplex carlsbadense 2-9-1]